METTYKEDHRVAGEYNHIEVRLSTIITADGEESKTYHRRVLSPCDDVSHESADIQNTANEYWTADVISAYENIISSGDINAQEAFTKN